MKKPRVDWVKAKIEYVSDSTLRSEDIAAKYGVAIGTVTARASREKWMEARESHNRILQESAVRKHVNAAAIELAKYNEQDLIVAKLGRTLAGQKLQAAVKRDAQGKQYVDIPSKELRMLMGAIESAQRIARLALGASTTNINDQTLDPLIGEINVESLSDDELISFQQSYQQLLTQTFGNGRERTQTARGSQVQ